MAKLINNTGLIADEELTQISLADWQSNSDALMGQKLELVLKSDETVDLINEGAAQFARISIEFPKFSDGRGYSAARLLREKYGYDGELRAIGDVLIDQLFFMKRQTLTEQRALIVGIVLIADTEGRKRGNGVIQILIITQCE